MMQKTGPTGSSMRAPGQGDSCSQPQASTREAAVGGSAEDGHGIAIGSRLGPQSEPGDVDMTGPENSIHGRDPRTERWVIFRMTAFGRARSISYSGRLNGKSVRIGFTH